MADRDNLKMRLMQNPEFAKEYARTKPFADVVMQIIIARNEAGLTQAQLARRIGTTQSVISRLESFESGGINLNTLYRIADALGLDVSIGLERREAG